MPNNIDQVNYNYDTNIPSGWDLNEYNLALARNKGAVLNTDGATTQAIYLAPFMPSYEAITPGGNRT